jgi:hypothetical protein
MVDGFLKVVLGLVSIAVKEDPAAQLGTELPAIPLDGTATAEKATTDHAGLQLEIGEGPVASRTPMLARLRRLFHMLAV